MMIRLLAIAFCLCLSHAAQAQNAWSAPGSACIPAATTIGRYDTDLASVRHAANEVDTIVFTCQIDRFNEGNTKWNLKITYRDSTGADGSAFVRARIYRMPIGTATPSLLAQVSSNASAVTTVNTVASSEFTHTFDFEANSYWVQVTLNRTNDRHKLVLYSVVIDGTSV